MDPPPAEGNFCDENNRPVKPHIVEWYNRHMGYVDNSDRMATSHSMSRRTLKWTTKLFFHLPDLTVLNSWIVLSSCGAKYTHRDFRLLLVRNLIEEAEKSQDQVRLKQMLCNSRAAITSTGQRNHHRNSAADCVLAAREKALCVNVPDVMWACVGHLVSWNITPK